MAHDLRSMEKSIFNEPPACTEATTHCLGNVQPPTIGLEGLRIMKRGSEFIIPDGNFQCLLEGIIQTITGNLHYEIIVWGKCAIGAIEYQPIRHDRDYLGIKLCGNTALIDAVFNVWFDLVFDFIRQGFSGMNEIHSGSTIVALKGGW